MMGSNWIGKFANLASLEKKINVDRKEGFFTVEDQDDYHSLSEHCSSTYIKNVVNHSYNCAEYMQQKGMKRSPAMIFGSVFHGALEHYEKWEEMIVCQPRMDRRSKAGKEEYNAWTEQHKKSLILFEDDHAKMKEILSNAQKKKVFTDLMEKSKGKREICGAYYDWDYGLNRKFMIDAVIEEEDQITLVDWKTTSKSATAKDFRRAVYNYKYHLQAAYYLDSFKDLSLTTKHVRFIFVPFETTAPFDCAFFEVDQELLAEGRKLYCSGLKTISEIRRTGNKKSKSLPDSIQLLERSLYN